MATRCRCPPESWAGRRLSRSSIPSMALTPFTRIAISSFGIFRSFRPNARFLYTVMCG